MKKVLVIVALLIFVIGEAQAEVYGPPAPGSLSGSTSTEQDGEAAAQDCARKLPSLGGFLNDPLSAIPDDASVSIFTGSSGVRANLGWRFYEFDKEPSYLLPDYCEAGASVGLGNLDLTAYISANWDLGGNTAASARLDVPADGGGATFGAGITIGLGSGAN
ncbi:MAG: hypothetical protein KDD66_06330 [Bdellovibrionales bacterium]|nr:hypothetical protein [Bdellovibrionales bacterium]